MGLPNVSSMPPGAASAVRVPGAGLKGLLLAAVAALHLLLLMWLQDALRSPPSRAPDSQAPVVLIRQLPPPAAATEPPPEPPRPPRLPPRPAARPAAPTAPIQAAPAVAESPPIAPAPASAPALAAAPPLPASAAASAPPAGRLLDTAASRQAIREAARRPSAREQGAIATGEDAPLGAQERLGQEIARGARGDCLKGEYAGSGMGLLSLPFWLIAELNEKCRR